PPVMLVELLFQAACVSLFLPGGQGRVYPGRKKPASFAVERRRVGPHVCFSGFGSGCCPGWMLSPGSGQCTLPPCSFGCGRGLLWHVAPCHLSLQHPPGAVPVPGRGRDAPRAGCRPWGIRGAGATVQGLGSPLLPPDIDECLSAACEGLCVNTEGGFVCECGPGMQLSTDRHSCQDVNECRRPGERRACQHACHNTPGSYLCSCRPGYRLSGDRVSC
ncbi:von Willebrand factor C and EGF domain-containing protein, partial [Aptenodytes forsteri]